MPRIPLPQLTCTVILILSFYCYPALATTEPDVTEGSQQTLQIDMENYTPDQSEWSVKQIGKYEKKKNTGVEKKIQFFPDLEKNFENSPEKKSLSEQHSTPKKTFQKIIILDKSQDSQIERLVAISATHTSATNVWRDSQMPDSYWRDYTGATNV